MPNSTRSYLICIELSFLDEPGRHVLRLGLLLGWVALVLIVEMLILSLPREKHTLTTHYMKEVMGYLRVDTIYRQDIHSS